MATWTMLTQLGEMGWLYAILAAVIAYFLGCVNGAVIVSKYILRDDVRTHGSGNAGLTNFHRVFGGPLTLVVILMDVVKMIAAVLIGVWLLRFSGQATDDFARFWAGLFCLVGHMFPCMFHFKGGKGILSGGTLLWMLDWRVALIAWGGFLVLAVITRWVSLGSISTGITYPLGAGIFFKDWVLLILAAVSGILIIWQHRSNLKRILSGTESKFSLHGKKEKGEKEP